jgi:hypothetical protein
MQNQHTHTAVEINKASLKQTWSTPAVQDFSPGLIQQQEEEELMRLLSDENTFRLLTGSTN